MPNLKKKYGAKWALITGGSTGIGYQFAEDLASQDVNVVLLANNKDRLENAKTKINEKYPNVEVRTISVDLSGDALDLEKALDEHVAELNVNIVFSNAGYGTTFEFEEVGWEAVQKHINCNVVAHVKVAEWFLKQWKSRGKQATRGAIIFTSSVASYVPIEMLSELYGASKAYLSIFAGSFAIRTKKFGLDTLVIQPGPVTTRFSEVAKIGKDPLKKYFQRSPSSVSRLIFNALGKFTSIETGFFSVIVKALTRFLGKNLIVYVSQKTSPTTKKDK
ncbi:oxidoreductase [Anaeramoeba flamelloides]|nr:oxidoreductase [Anaeramoeba flamelloides]|eukprot:Anaeramoba_flamelloidesa86977_243.p1 GENE.a86977_243~~a86977_243.p1  ORF type:complete len:310 (+),score=67.32 a86977_243:105-932(+)